MGNRYGRSYQRMKRGELLEGNQRNPAVTEFVGFQNCSLLSCATRTTVGTAMRAHAIAVPYRRACSVLLPTTLHLLVGSLDLAWTQRPDSALNSNGPTLFGIQLYRALEGKKPPRQGAYRRPEIPMRIAPGTAIVTGRYHPIQREALPFSGQQ
jgi:hypothetical protein